MAHSMVREVSGAAEPDTSETGRISRARNKETAHQAKRSGSTEKVMPGGERGPHPIGCAAGVRYCTGITVAKPSRSPALGGPIR